MDSERFILTAAEMRAAEQAADAGEQELMERAGACAAEAIHLYAGHMSALVLCGPGNNGGDGYVIARILREWGWKVRVAATGEPASEAAIHARSLWQGAVEPLSEARPAPLLIDALFGTGLARPLDEAVAGKLAELAGKARICVAVDLPSGISADDGQLLSPVPDYDLTITFGAAKPAHLLQPAARHMGRLVVADIGVETRSGLRLIERPRLPAPGPDDHKYSRGYVAVAGGAMPGAAALAASAAAKAGAGYVRLVGEAIAPVAQAIVQSGDGGLDDERIGALVIGPGLGRDERAKALLNEAMGANRPLVLDGDALTLLAGSLPLAGRPILTPHAGEFARMFGDLAGSKVEQAREAAALSGAVVVFKGADTVVAAPDGRAAIACPAPSWLASAGTGDVLAGVAGAMRAKGLEAFEAACAAVWLHGRAAELAGPNLIADDLLDHLAAAVGECL